MSPFRLDAMSRTVLGALCRDVPVDADAMAARIGCSAEMVRDRLGRLRADGVLSDVRAHVERKAVGMAYELLVHAAPGPRTTREAMRRLCAAPMVTRAFTLASRLPIAFTLGGDSVPALEEAARRLAAETDLHEVQTALIVRTLVDDPLRGLIGKPETPGLGERRGAPAPAGASPEPTVASVAHIRPVPVAVASIAEAPAVATDKGAAPLEDPIGG